MRTIEVSTETFAAVWARRENGEESEDAILRRILLGPKARAVEDSAARSVSSDGGVVDLRNGVTFGEGFQIFRRYKGKDFEAVATKGSWHRLDNGVRYPTINQLNGSIAAGAENVWNGNWKFRDDRGRVRSIAVLRK